MRAALVFPLSLLACGHGEERRAKPVSARAIAPVSAGLTHGAPIMMVAITEQADAALTVDELGSVRLWPTLDGTRPPVPVNAIGVMQLVLGRAGDELLAGFLSEAGDVLLVRFGRDGAVHGRAQIPGDIACTSIAAIDGGVLVVRVDQTIERYDVDAIRRGRIVGERNMRLDAIASRRGGAVALLSTETDTQAGWAAPITLAPDLAWGATVPLSAPVVLGALALSPDHRLIAVIDAATEQLRVLALATGTQVGSTFRLDTLDVAFGFSSDDRLAVVSSDIRWWRPDGDSTPPNRSSWLNIAGGAVGDDLAIAGTDAALALLAPNTVHYLGWNRSSLGSLGTSDSAVLLAAGDTVASLDGHLALTSERSHVAPARLTWLDSRHVVEIRDDISIVDLDRRSATVHIPSRTVRTYYQPETHQLAVHEKDAQIDRYAIDLDHLQVTKLESLEITPYFSTLSRGRVHLLDPAHANGVIAIADWDERWGRKPGVTNIAIYRAPTTAATTVRASRKLTVAQVLAVDSTGTMYVRDTENGPIIARHDGQPDVMLGTIIATALVPSRDGRLLVTTRENEVAAFDASGLQRWRHTVLDVSGAVFSADDRNVIVQSPGGLVSFDASTGAEIASACSFSFGLRTEPPVTTALHAEPICRP